MKFANKIESLCFLLDDNSLCYKDFLEKNRYGKIENFKAKNSMYWKIQSNKQPNPSYMNNAFKVKMFF